MEYQEKDVSKLPFEDVDLDHKIKYENGMSPPLDNNSSAADIYRAIALDPVKAKKEKRRIMKNILLISLAFLFNFNAFSVSNRRTSAFQLIHDLHWLRIN